MSEQPVGNMPRSSGIPNNSHKARENNAPAPSGEPREELTKIVTGKVSLKKSPWYKRIGRSLIADDASSVGGYIIEDVVGPAIRNLIYDVITGGAARTLYGSTRGGGLRRESTIRGGGPVSSIRTRYDKMSEEGPGGARRGMSQEARARHDFQEVVLGDRQEAVGILEALIDYIGRYGTVTVAELYTLCGVTGSHADRSWGWSDLSTADIRQYRQGWLIDLPDAQPLR